MGRALDHDPGTLHVVRRTLEYVAPLAHGTLRRFLGGDRAGVAVCRRIPLFQDPGGVQALKTGFTREAGYNLAVSAWRAGERFLLIVLGAQTRSLSFRDARALLQYGFHETGIETAPEPKHPVPAPTRRPTERRSRARATLPRGG